jgi:hypothetical protein
MELTKAIEILRATVQTGSYVPNSGQEIAVQLGIQALIKIQDLRTRFPLLMPEPLPDQDPE